MKTYRILLYALVVALLCVAYGCATVKPMGGAAVGAGAGLLVAGPLGGAVGAAAGAGGGALWQQVSQAGEERDECKAEQVRLHAALEDLRATLKANAQIDTYNLTSTRKVPHTTTTDPPTDTFSLAWKVLLALLGGGVAYHFRREIGAWARGRWAWAQDKLRGRAPGAPKPPADPSPRPTPLNPEP